MSEPGLPPVGEDIFKARRPGSGGGVWREGGVMEQDVEAGREGSGK